MSKRNITYIKPEEPAFLKKLKEKAGFKEGPTIDTKREMLPPDFDSDEDHEDEKPTVVVLKPGDLTAEEVEAISQEQEKDETDARPTKEEEEQGGRIMFKKPPKREASEQKGPPNKKTKKNSHVKKLDNTKLLSFDEEEDDD